MYAATSRIRAAAVRGRSHDAAGPGEVGGRTAVDAPEGSRNGYGTPRKLTLTCGTITVQRPRVRGLVQRFVSRLLPLFKRRTKQGGTTPPVVSARIGARRFRARAPGAVGRGSAGVAGRAPPAQGPVAA
ncbi:protein of unknown function [Candidatus Nitrospira inopinata]|uniref:Uncharacterized protein n=1 Tax=Candidatus Nitrospira inopinata TaxID=1715989 RepID=A0A0S4KNB4_9BACT|nr:protein of unknown function [Candidatus Nitrospira inopinata]